MDVILKYRKIERIVLAKSDKNITQLKAEREPIVKDPPDRSWSKVDLVTMSYGYGTQFTALRIAH